jgi:hypothetical protein
MVRGANRLTGAVISKHNIQVGISAILAVRDTKKPPSQFLRVPFPAKVPLVHSFKRRVQK